MLITFNFQVSSFNTAFTLSIFAAQQIVAVFPVYWLVKAMFLIWLYLPVTSGATIIYQKVSLTPFIGESPTILSILILRNP